MKTQNMKLLDLETGKYLELRKDFYYGGEAIIVHSYTKEELTDCEEFTGFEQAINHDSASVKLWIEYKSEPPTELKEICEKVGAVVYGGRYVLIENEYCGDILFVQDRFDYWNKFYSVCKSDGTLTNQRLGDWITKVLGNIFEEYSKKLRNEPNQFDELKELLK